MIFSTTYDETATQESQETTFVSLDKVREILGPAVFSSHRMVIYEIPGGRLCYSDFSFNKLPPVDLATTST